MPIKHINSIFKRSNQTQLRNMTRMTRILECAQCCNLITFGTPRVVFIRKGKAAYKHQFAKDCAGTPGVPGTELLNARKALKMSQRKAAETLGIPFSQFRSMEKGVAASNLVTSLKALAPKKSRKPSGKKFSPELRAMISTFGQEIKSLRKSQRLTREVFSKRVGISYDRLEGIERGLIKAPEDVANRIMSLLKPSPAPIKKEPKPAKFKHMAQAAGPVNTLVTVNKRELEKYIAGYNNWIFIQNMIKKGI